MWNFPLNERGNGGLTTRTFRRPSAKGQKAVGHNPINRDREVHTILGLVKAMVGIVVGCVNVHGVSERLKAQRSVDDQTLCAT